MTNRHTTVVRNPTTGAGVAGVVVDMRTLDDDTLVDSATTDSDGVATFDHDDVLYPGPVYTEADVGATHREQSGMVWGQLGGLFWADDINDAFSALGIGVVPDLLNQFNKSVTGSNMVVSIQSGVAVLKDGMVYRSESTQNITFVTNPFNDQYQYISLRLTREGQTEQGKIELISQAGATGIPAFPPNPVQNSVAWDLPLWSVYIPAAATSISSGQVTDLRPYLQIPPVASAAAGDLVSVGSDKKPFRLAIGSTNQVLTVAAGLPAWAAVPTPAAGDLPSGIDAAKIGAGAVSNTEFGYLDGVTSAIQTQIAGKAASSHTHAQSDITGLVSALAAKAPSASPSFTGDADFAGAITLDGPLRDNSGTGWTATAGAAMGSSPGSMTRDRNEYAGRIVQQTGSSGTNPGALWNVVFEHARATANYIVIVQGGNNDTAGIMPYVSSTSTTGFTISCVGDPPNSTSLRISWFIVDCA